MILQDFMVLNPLIWRGRGGIFEEVCLFTFDPKILLLMTRRRNSSEKINDGTRQNSAYFQKSNKESFFARESFFLKGIYKKNKTCKQKIYKRFQNA